MPEPIILNTSGPHSPEYTKQVADAFAEAVHVLNYATMGDAPGLDYPGDVYALLGALSTATSHLPELLGHLVAFLRAQETTGTLADDHGRDVTVRIAVACGALITARDMHAESLARNLKQAQNAISGLYTQDTGGA